MVSLVYVMYVEKRNTWLHAMCMVAVFSAYIVDVERKRSAARGDGEHGAAVLASETRGGDISSLFSAMSSMNYIHGQ